MTWSREREEEHPAGGRRRDGDTVTDAIESVVKGQRRKGQKRKHWDGDGEEDGEEEEQQQQREDGEVLESEGQLVEREENLGNLMARSRTGTGRCWLTQDELQHFRG